MKLKIIIALLIVIFFIFLYNPIQLFSASSKNNTNQEPTQVHNVSLYEDRAEPDIVFAKVGEYIQFNSKDGKSHEISQGVGDMVEDGAHDHLETGLTSGEFQADEGYRVQLKKTGTYKFHDHTNPKLFITVVVYQPK